MNHFSLQNVLPNYRMKKDRFIIPALWLLSCAIVFLIAGKMSQTPEKNFSSLEENDSRLQARGSSATNYLGRRKSQRRISRASLLAESNLEKTIDSIMANDDNFSRSEDLLTLVNRLTVEDYPKVLKALIKKDFDGQFFTDYLFILRSWAQADPSAAMEFVTRERKDKYDRLEVIRYWASYDRKGISQWIEANVPNENSRRWYLEEASYGARQGEFFDK